MSGYSQNASSRRDANSNDNSGSYMDGFVLIGSFVLVAFLAMVFRELG